MATVLEWKAEGWPDGFAWSEEAAAVLHLIDDAFAGVEQPQNFTNADHCAECFEHDMVLKARPRMMIRRADLGQSCFDPVAFTNPPGIAYLMPALARYAMAPDLWPDLEVLSQISAGYAMAGMAGMLRGGIVVQRTSLRALGDPAVRTVVPGLWPEPSGSRGDDRRTGRSG